MGKYSVDQVVAALDEMTPAEVGQVVAALQQKYPDLTGRAVESTSTRVLATMAVGSTNQNWCVVLDSLVGPNYVARAVIPRAEILGKECPYYGAFEKMLEPLFRGEVYRIVLLTELRYSQAEEIVAAINRSRGGHAFVSME